MSLRIGFLSGFLVVVIALAKHLYQKLTNVGHTSMALTEDA